MNTGKITTASNWRSGAGPLRRALTGAVLALLMVVSGAQAVVRVGPINPDNGGLYRSHGLHLIPDT
jgi:hypothetical protein